MSWIPWVQFRKIPCPEFMCFNQRHFISITLSWRCHVSYNFLANREFTTILLQGNFHHHFYQVRVKKTVFLIFQLTFVQDSQILLLPQVQTIVTLFLDMTWCVQLLQIIETCANTGNEWLHQTLQPVVFINAARIIRIFFIPLTSAIWLNIYALLKSIFNGIFSSNLPVTWENIFIQK